jgi:hypothetical protein
LADKNRCSSCFKKLPVEQHQVQGSEAKRPCSTVPLACLHLITSGISLAHWRSSCGMQISQCERARTDTSASPHSQPAATHCHTVTLSHCHTVTQSHTCLCCCPCTWSRPNCPGLYLSGCSNCDDTTGCKAYASHAPASSTASGPALGHTHMRPCSCLVG